MSPVTLAPAAGTAAARRAFPSRDWFDRRTCGMKGVLAWLIGIPIPIIIILYLVDVF